MTRFARAKGSKSCNVKQPEEPTSWAEMKKGLQMQLTKVEDYSSARNALDSVKKQKKDIDKPAVWGTLASDSDASNALCFLKAQLKKRKEKNNDDDNANRLSNNKNDGKKKKKTESESKKEESEGLNGSVGEVDEVPVKKNKKLKKSKDDANSNLIENGVGKKSNKAESESVIVERKRKKEEKEGLNGIVGGVDEVPVKKNKKSKKSKDDADSNLIENGVGKKSNKRKQNDEEISNVPENEKVAKKKPKKAKEVVEEIRNDETTNVEDNPKKIKKRKSNDTSDNTETVNETKKKKKNPVPKAENSDTNPKHPQSPKKDNKRQDRKKKFEHLKQKRKEKREKLKDLQPQERRRKPLPETQEAHINGQTVKLEMFDGFWVTQEDAERLKKLKDDMFQKNIPLKDINGAIKLERRRAEKALARLKKKVCFQCRKSGHALSECPEITENHNKATNVCYKCGSTEHTAYLCKVSQGDQFRFAECFVCKEQGHIAKQCPDNPRGLYPKGGSCNVCGDVTHLKKDCLKLISQKEEATISVGVRDDRMIEDLDEQLFENKNNAVKSNAKRNKHVRF